MCDSLEVQGPKDLVLTEINPGVLEVGAQQVSLQTGQPDALKALALGGVGLTGAKQGELCSHLEKWKGVFVAHDNDYGCTGVICHQINIGEAAPIREHYRPIPQTLYNEMHSLLEGMLQTGVIQGSTSPCATPIVLVRKKDHSWRFCVDYRKLNVVTHKDAYPLPRIEEVLTTLSKATCYSTLDLASGYWQVEVDPRDREKTAFITPLGLYEFNQMPFGLCNAPATFQWLIQNCLGGLVTESLMVYLDDVIVYSIDLEAHFRDLETVFERLSKYGLKLKPWKCQLFQKQVKFLGHVVRSFSGPREGIQCAGVGCTTDSAAGEIIPGVRGVLSVFYSGFYRHRKATPCLTNWCPKEE